MSISTVKSSVQPSSKDAEPESVSVSNPIQYHRGNIVAEVTEGVILQGVNCANGMGSGLAWDILVKYPVVKDVFHKIEPLLGSICPIKTHVPGLVVVNGYTQQKYGREVGVKYADIAAIEDVLSKTFAFCEARGFKDIHTVQLGCGLGGLSWKEVFPVFESVASTARKNGMTASLHIWEKE